MISLRLTALAFFAAGGASATAQTPRADATSMRAMPAAVAERYGRIMQLLPPPARHKLDGLVSTFINEVLQHPRSTNLQGFAASEVHAQFPDVTPQQSAVLVFVLLKQTADGLSAQILNRPELATPQHISTQAQAVQLASDQLRAMEETGDNIIQNIKP
jgi:hypothetical protein